MTPVEFELVKNMQTTLQGVRREDGYHHTIAAVAVKLDPNHEVEDMVAPNGPRPMVILEVLPETRDYNRSRGSMSGGIALGVIGIMRPFRIHWVHETEPTDDDSRLRTFFQGCADVERALTRDISRGAVAGAGTVTRIVRTACEELGTELWAMTDVEITFQRTYGEPNAA